MFVFAATIILVIKLYDVNVARKNLIICRPIGTRASFSNTQKSEISCEESRLTVVPCHDGPAVGDLGWKKNTEKDWRKRRRDRKRGKTRGGVACERERERERGKGKENEKIGDVSGGAQKENVLLSGEKANASFSGIQRPAKSGLGRWRRCKAVLSFAVQKSKESVRVETERTSKMLIETRRDSLLHYRKIWTLLNVLLWREIIPSILRYSTSSISLTIVLPPLSRTLWREYIMKVNMYERTYALHSISVHVLYFRAE